VVDVLVEVEVAEIKISILQSETIEILSLWSRLIINCYKFKECSTLCDLFVFLRTRINENICSIKCRFFYSHKL